ncbi:hypothetical protein EG329_003251 [Mollisiaceae sp. DMI_Dod_QoI]|nr:hypothetical protein EG329_003251 [Helotiales sp. DMI_Dod_QoI]
MKCNDGTQIREYGDEISLGRPIVDNSKDDECLNIASMWLARCTKYHGTKCRKLQNVKLPTRLLQIPRSNAESIRLKETGEQTGQYVALSHCWGENGIDDQTKTTSETMGDKMHGFLASSLPQSFQDAIYIARRLGFEYIWIDALCIIQDDLDDWSREASQMAEVYGNASLTISADRARDSKDGIFGQRSTHRSPCFDQHGEWFLQKIGGGWATIDSMPLSQRGWTVQERFLSPRTIHYLEEQLAWECRTGIYLEEHRSCVVPTGHFSQGLFQGQTEQSDMRHAGSGPENVHRNGKKDLRDELMNTTFRVHSWNECIREWSMRCLTVPSDRFPSLSGLATAAETHQMGDYIAGLWEYDIFNSMSWFPDGQLTVEGITLKSTYKGPSWSWVSAGCPIYWCCGFPSYNPVIHEAEIYKKWDKTLAPRLLRHHIDPSRLTDPKGEVLKGSYLMMQGYTREIYVGSSRTISSCPKGISRRECCNEPSCRQPWEPGTLVRMDSIANKWNVPGSFTRDSIDNGVENADSKIKSFVCVQISRQMGPDKCEHPKIIGLLLDRMDDGFKRVGLATFDLSICGPSDDWKLRDLKLY